jgi:hypothetical protein
MKKIMKTQILFLYSLVLLATSFIGEVAQARDCTKLTVNFVDKDPKKPDAPSDPAHGDVEVHYVECGGSLTTGYARRHVSNVFMMQPNQNVTIAQENTQTFLLNERLPNRQFPGDQFTVACWGTTSMWDNGPTKCQILKR